MTEPITLAQQAAYDALCQAAQRLNCTAAPALNSIRFRADGKGGEVASPFPMTAGLDARTVAEVCPLGDWFAKIYPSGGWIAFDMNDGWRDYVRAWTELPPSIRVDIPPVPAFPAYIHPKSWRFSALLRQNDPMTAARLDLGNPWQRLHRAIRLAGQCRGENQADRDLVNLAALSCYGNPQALLTLADAYLSHPGEDELVARYLTRGAGYLGVENPEF